MVQVKCVTSLSHWFLVVWRGWFMFPTSAKQWAQVDWNVWGLVGEEKTYDNFGDDEEGNFQIL